VPAAVARDAGAPLDVVTAAFLVGGGSVTKLLASFLLGWAEYYVFFIISVLLGCGA
jgi:hypothetical protein